VRVIVGKVFGIGNAVLSLPMVKALASLGHDIDILVGDRPDDFGAKQVFSGLERHEGASGIRHVWSGSVPLGVPIHDLAIMAIPYDGRWRNGIDFFAREVMDARPRPGDPARIGFDSWVKHEVEYQMDNARALGYVGETPDCSFMPRPPDGPDPDLVYLGIGYKRDPGGFGFSKHFGNSRLADLMGEVRGLRPSVRFLSTGNDRDAVEVGFPIMRSLCSQTAGRTDAYRMEVTSLERSFSLVMGCGAYLGNDTGMMHVAAASGVPTMGLMAHPGLLIKNPPFCKPSRSILFTADSPPIRHIAEQFVGLVWGDR